MFTQAYLTKEINRCRLGVFIASALASANAVAIGLCCFSISHKVYYPAGVILPICLMILRANYTGFCLMFFTLKKLHREQERLEAQPQRVHAPRINHPVFGEPLRHDRR